MKNPLTSLLAKQQKPEAKTSEVEILDHAGRPYRQARRFEGAKVNRLTLDWLTTQNRLDADLHNDLSRLIQRTRDMEQNDSYTEGFLKQVERNVVGANPFTLQMKIREPNGAHDKTAEQTIEHHWKDFCKARNLTVTEQLSFADMCRIIIRQAITDGGILIRKHLGVGKYRIQIEPLDIDYLDIEYNTTLPNGNVVRMSIETNRMGKVVAYHLLGEHPGDYMYRTGANRQLRTRVDSKQIYHVFLPKRAQQTRGYPEFASSIRDNRDLKGYREAEITAARTAAAKMGFFTKPSGEGAAYMGPDADKAGKYMDAEPGAMEELPAGLQFQQWDPQHPTSQYGSFTKEVLRSMATSLGVSYMTFANDAGDANFSSARIHLLEERETWKMLQGILVDHFVEPLFCDWLYTALASQTVALPLAKYDKFCHPHFQGKRWPWVDPKNDMEAAILAMEKGIKSPADIVAEFGSDEEEVLDAIRQTLLDRAELGLVAGTTLDAIAKATQTEEVQGGMVQSLGAGGLQAMTAVLAQIGDKTLTPKQGQAILETVFGLPPEKAAEMMP